MVLQAMRGYRKHLEELDKAKQQQKEAQEVQENERAEIERRTSPEYQAQVKEFEDFLTSEVEKGKPFPFLKDMYDKHMRGEVFTSRMQDAIRRCMKRRDEEAAKAPEAPEAPRMITLLLPQFLMLDMGLDSRVVTGEVLRESGKAWLVKGTADMQENMSWCVRCGKELKEPASQITGMGRICAEKVGIPYDPIGVLAMTKRQRAAIRKKFVKHLKAQTFERWLPKSRCEVLDD